MSEFNWLEKVGLLLKQAEGASTEAEASTFMDKAYALAGSHRIDLALARQAIAHREKREEPTSKSIYWGALGTKNTKKHLVTLFSAIASANDLKNDIKANSSGVTLYGFPSDMEVAELLFASLAVQMVEAGDAYVRSGVFKNETMRRQKRVPNPYYNGGYWSEPKTIVKWGDYPVDGRTARANFYQGFISRVSSRLRDAKRDAEALAQSEQDAAYVAAPVADIEPEKTGVSLVLFKKAEEVKAHYKATSTAKGSWSGYSGGRSSTSRSAGSAAGSVARLSAQQAIGGAKIGIAS